MRGACVEMSECLLQKLETAIVCIFKYSFNYQNLNLANV